VSRETGCSSGVVVHADADPTGIGRKIVDATVERRGTVTTARRYFLSSMPLDPRKVWIFGVAEHWNAEFLGWHVTKRGTRFEATQALAMAVRQQFGHLCAGAARGLALRHDHGSNFMAEHFQKQARFWGISPSYAFVGEPETNDVIERFFRTMKEQAIHGHVFQTIDEVRDAVRTFAARYNDEWLIEKNVYLSPLDARAARLDTTLQRAA
jgi:putative transposase